VRRTTAMRWAVLLLGALLLLAACGAPQERPLPGAQPPPAADRETEALLRLGQERLAQGMPLEASDAFRAALARAPRPEYQAQAQLGLARSERALGDNQQALHRLNDMLSRRAAPVLAVEANLLAAGLELDLKRPGEAASRLRLLLSRPPGPLSQTERFRAQGLLARALAQSGRAGEAAAQLVALADQADAPELRELADQLAQVAGKARSSELTPLLSQTTWPELKSALLLGLAEAYVREGRPQEAERTLAALRAEPSAGRWAQRLRELDSQASQARLVQPRSVGVILPLSGNYAAFGKRLLAAVQLGLGLFSNVGGQPPTLHIEDSRNDPESAAQAVSRLVERNKVIAIIGPVGAAASLSAARRAQQLGVPLISLSQVEGVTLAGPFVFQNSFTPEAQVAALLNQVMEGQGLRRVAVLAPRNSYGQGFARVMAAQLAARGGSLTHSEYYPPAQADFASYVKSLAGLPPGNYRPGHPDSPKPDIKFDALFVPDGPEAAAMIAPQLAYHDVLGVQLMGTSLWHNPKLIAQGGRYVDDCLFPDAFDANSPAALIRSFVDDFQRALGQEPGVMEAQAYDAGYVLRHFLMNSLPPATRAALRERLASLRGLEGVCGTLSVDEDRRISKPLALFTVRSGEFTPLSHAGPRPAGRGSAPPAPPAAVQPAPAASDLRLSPPRQGGFPEERDAGQDSSLQPSVIPAKPMPLLPAPAAEVPR